MPHRIIHITRAIEYLAVKSKLFYWLASHYYRNVIQNEIALANITHNDHVLCIGGGVCPFSAILFHQITGAKVTVIDNCENCIREAQHIIDRLGLSDHVHAIWQDGSTINFSLSEFSIVHFALQVFPMNAVFPKVKKQVIPGTKLLVRRPKEAFNKVYSQLTDSLQNCWRLPKQTAFITHQKACNIGSTLLYIKQERLNKEKTPRPLSPAGFCAADSSIDFSRSVAV